MTKPPILTRLESQLRAKGMPAGQAAAVARKKLTEFGNLKPGTIMPTAKGKARGEMSAGARAVDRAASYSGRPRSDYAYSSKTNRATLKK